ncbi:hemolysin D [Kaistia algarum]|uniref:HlyD family secretion protein n=1 Tax=Kaistia algarum TaxID=2083279 RepID=UPI000CE8E0A8|nr:HlyD family secretion protein [Kaistia algarum]MCX5512479.1 HlyD family secretion protein [Kaistia algarum]PPE80556.1 hemolysin D [Kaistia algarum]
MAKVALVETSSEEAGGTTLDARRTAELPAAKPAEAPAAPVAAAPSKPAEPKKKGGRRRIVLSGLGLVAIVAGAYFGHEWWTIGRFMESTDDAYISADSAVIAPRLSGYVASVPAVANSRVKAGDPLVQLDDADERLAVAAIEDQIASQQATLSRIDKQTEAAKAGIAQAQATITSAAADLELAKADLDRATQLNASQFASRQSLEQAQATSDKAKAATASADAGLTTAEANVAVLQAQRVEAERALDQLRTTLDQKKLELDRTVIRAPFDGIVGNRAVDPGEYVSAGQRLLALVPIADLYIDANFKETQLARIRPGATATITVDAADGPPIIGTVESIAPASGAVFSLLPPDNATGNFTKITQRVTVRIRVPANAIASGNLRPGLSVTVEVDSRTGGASQSGA